jgi:hypothetical protein
MRRNAVPACHTLPSNLHWGWGLGWFWFFWLRPKRQRLRQRFAWWRLILNKSVKRRHWKLGTHLQVRKAWQNSYLLGCDIGPGYEQALDTWKIVPPHIPDSPTASYQPVHFNHICHFGVHAMRILPLKVALLTNKPMQHARHVTTNRTHGIAKG